MKQLLLFTGLLLLASHFLIAQQRPYNVVFDLTSRDTNDHKMVLRWINLIVQPNPDAKVEVVFYGQSLDMVVKDKSVVAEEVKKLATNKNVAFRVCAIAMQHHNIDKSQLLTGVETVPDGIYEIISKQGEGWGYIKATH